MKTWFVKLCAAALVCVPLLVNARLSEEERQAVRETSPSRTVRALAAGRVQWIVCHGTSLTYGGAWVDQIDRELRRRFPCRVLMINSGVGGQASPSGVRNLQERVLRAKPDCVFMEFAINDAYEGYNIPVEACRENLETMIDRILETNPECEIILMTMNPVVGKAAEVRPNLDAYYQVYRDMARERGLILVDHHANWTTVLSADRTAFDRFIPDGLHPAPLGCSVVVTPAILAALGFGSGFAESWNDYLAKTAEIEPAPPRDVSPASRAESDGIPSTSARQADGN